MPLAPDVGLRPEAGNRPLFAHLRLRAEPTGPDALTESPTLRTIGCLGGPSHARLVANLVVVSSSLAAC